MKLTTNLLLLFVIFCSCFTHGENITLVRPGEVFFEKRDTTEEIMLSYLKTYFMETGDKIFKNYYRFENRDLSRNTWYQEFSKGIIYEYDTGGTADNITGRREYIVTILFPCTQKEDICMLVEELYKHENCIWYDSRKEIYGPKSFTVGFICEIKIEKNNIILRVCSNC